MTHLRVTVRMLADMDALNVVGGSGVGDSRLAAAIDFTQVFRTPQTLHFRLPLSQGPLMSSEIGMLALHALINSAAFVGRERKVQTFVFIDEFQRIVGSNLAPILEQARSMNVGLILANQSMASLKHGMKLDLTDAITQNTRLRMDFSVVAPDEQARYSRASGTQVVTLRGVQQTPGFFGDAETGYTRREQEQPRLTTNDLILATDHAERAVLHLRRGADYAQFGGFPIIVDTTYSMSAAEAVRRDRTAWPAVTDETMPSTERFTRRIDDEPGAPLTGPPRTDLFVDDDPAADGTAGGDVKPNGRTEDDPPDDPLAGLGED